MIGVEPFLISIQAQQYGVGNPLGHGIYYVGTKSKIVREYKKTNFGIESINLLITEMNLLQYYKLRKANPDARTQNNFQIVLTS